MDSFFNKFGNLDDNKINDPDYDPMSDIEEEEQYEEEQYEEAFQQEEEEEKEEENQQEEETDKIEENVKNNISEVFKLLQNKELNIHVLSDKFVNYYKEETITDELNGLNNVFLKFKNILKEYNNNNRKSIAFFTPTKDLKLSLKNDINFVSSNWVKKAIKHFKQIKNRSPTNKELNQLKLFCSVNDLSIQQSVSFKQKLEFDKENSMELIN